MIISTLPKLSLHIFEQYDHLVLLTRQLAILISTVYCSYKANVIDIAEASKVQNHSFKFYVKCIVGGSPIVASALVKILFEISLKFVLLDAYLQEIGIKFGSRVR